MNKRMLFIAAFIGIVFLLSACTFASNRVSISMECSSWGHYVLHVIYPSTGVTITRVIPGSDVRSFSCATMTGGNFPCTGEVNPNVHLLSV